MGIKELLHERSDRRELVIFIFTIGCFFYQPNLYTLILVILTLVLLAVESLNSSLEALCDFITKDYNPFIRKIKDLAACAVFFIVLSLFIVCIAWFFDLANLKI